MTRISYSILAVLVLTGCPPPPPADGGMDGQVQADTGTIDAGGARGLLRWGTLACNGRFDGSAPPPGTCMPVRTHISNTGVNAGPNPERLTCAARVQVAERTVLVGFAASETYDLSMPGRLELRGAVGALAAGPTMIGQTVTECEIRLTENGHTAVGRCGQDCTVTVTNVLAGTITGSVTCRTMPDDSNPPVFRTVRNADGVPLAGADFSLTDCTPAP